MKHAFALLWILALAGLGCGLDAALPSQPPTAAASNAAAHGLPVSYANTSFVIPDGLATGIAGQTVTDVELPYVNPSNGDMSRHLRIVLNGYAGQQGFTQPELLLFTAAEYAQYADLTQQIISTLQQGPYKPGEPLPAAYPVGPLYAQTGAVSFQNGRGVRYLTQFDEAALPINNHELFYYFHGLTGDGRYYVTAVLPIHAAFLQADSNPGSSVPAGGIPFPTALNPDLSKYYQDVQGRLNAADAGSFAPALATLDALIQSIRISPQ